MDSQQNKYQVYGELIIPFYFPTTGRTKVDALHKVTLILNRDNIELVDADIHTIDGRSHPLIAPDCRVNLYEVIEEGEI